MLTAKQSLDTPGVGFIVPLEAFQQANVNATLENTRSIDCAEISIDLIRQIANVPREAQAALSLLVQLSHFMLYPDDLKHPFRTINTLAHHDITTPEIYDDDQFPILSRFAESINNPGLRGRVADVTWFRQPDNQECANVAVGSYCQCIMEIAPRIHSVVSNGCPIERMQIVSMLTRAGVILSAMNSQLQSFSNFRNLTEQLLLGSFDSHQHKHFIEIAHVALNFPFISPEAVGELASNLARSNQLDEDDDVQCRLWELATLCYHLSNNFLQKQRCVVQQRECLASMADKAELNEHKVMFLHSAVVLCVENSINDERAMELEQLWHEIEQMLPNEPRIYPLAIDYDEYRAGIISNISGQPLSQALFLLMSSHNIPSREELQEHVKGLERCDPTLNASDLLSHADDGRVVFRTSRMSNEKTARMNHERYLMSKIRTIMRHNFVKMIVYPTCETIAKENRLCFQMFQEMFANSSFVPSDRKQIFAKGLAFFLSSQFEEAARLLVFELENSLRYMLGANGICVIRGSSDKVQEVMPLSRLLRVGSEQRSKLEDLLSPPYVQELDLLFDFRGGPNLRHTMSHGTFSNTFENWENKVYGTWFILHLALASLQHQ